jgi:hypothetical protein
VARPDPRPDADEPEGTDPGRLFAELEGGTEGPGGQGRDQEVITHTERGSSRVAEADRTVALAELRAWTQASIAQRQGIEVVSTGGSSHDDRVDRLRCLGSHRAMTVEFDPDAGMVTVYRDATLHARIDPYEGGSPDVPKRSIEAELNWLCGGSGP